MKISKLLAVVIGCTMASVSFANLTYSNQDLKQLKQNGECPKCDFSGMKSWPQNNVNHSGANVQSANFSNSHIDGLNLSRGNLKNADFSGSTLNNMDFDGANLQEASFAGATVKNSNFHKARNLDLANAAEVCGGINQHGHKQKSCSANS